MVSKNNTQVNSVCISHKNLENMINKTHKLQTRPILTPLVIEKRHKFQAIPIFQTEEFHPIVKEETTTTGSYFFEDTIQTGCSDHDDFIIVM